MTWFRFFGTPGGELLLWIVASIAVYVFGSHYAERWMERARTRSHAGQLLQLARFLYYVGLPYGLLRWRPDVVSPTSLGLAGFAQLAEANFLGWLVGDWFNGIGVAVALGGGLFFLLAGGWWVYFRAVRDLPDAGEHGAEEPVPAARLGGLYPPQPWWVAGREAIYRQAHWAFYRSGPLLWVDDYYVGVVLGFGLVCLEWSLSADWRASLGQPERAGRNLMDWSLALGTAVVYLFTYNLWLCILVHWAVDLACARWVKALYERHCQALASASRQPLDSQFAGRLTLGEEIRDRDCPAPQG